MLPIIYEIIGIGIGPFNLGLAALLDEIPNLQYIFADAKESFDWHPGLMLDNARMQVPFYADLVTLANPCSKYSYLNFLKNKERLFRFAIHEHYFPTRKEYNTYCQWVVSQLSSLQFNKTCTGIFYSRQKQCYGVQLRDNKSRNTICYWTKHIVIGTGTVPAIPEFAKDIKHPLVFHSGEYLKNKNELLQCENITIVGSGQSAAEIFNDLLDSNSQRELNWFTRSDRFFPMEYSKLTLEMSSPDYIDYFHRLHSDQKRILLKDQDALYKGINFSLIGEIYDKLYLHSLDEKQSQAHLYTSCELQKIAVEAGNRLSLTFKHKYTESLFEHLSGAVILATGYKNIIPDFLDPVKELIDWTADGFYNVQGDYSISKILKTIFVQNADLHSHGFNSADLGLGPYRNAIILNSILQKEHFKLENNIAFQSFGLPSG
jgi:lysine N6-hydroxylase